MINPINISLRILWSWLNILWVMLPFNTTFIARQISEMISLFDPNKALGKNGLSSHFYRKCWYFIKFDLPRMINFVLQSAQMGWGIKLKFLGLVPKEVNPSSFSLFCPISLCIVSYKTISKIIANHLKLLLLRIIYENYGTLWKKWEYRK